VFISANREIVKEVNEAAQIPFTWIVEALDLTPQRKVAKSKPDLDMSDAANATSAGSPWLGNRPALR